METQTCLRCNLSIRRENGCICTSPNWRFYSPSELEYLRPSTKELPLLWLSLFMERREIYRFRGDFFAHALKNPNDVIQINEYDNYYDLKWEVHGAPEPYIRKHYSSCLYSIVKGEVAKSLLLMKDALSNSDFKQGKHLFYIYSRTYDDILHNMRKIEKPSDNYDALQNAFDGLNTFIEKEKEYYFSDKPEREIANQPEQSEEDLHEELMRIGKLENEFWKYIPMTEVIKHFEKLAINKNKKGEQYLTFSQLKSFLKRGFLNDQQQEKQLINCPVGEKGFVISLFYNFFDIAVSNYWHPVKKEPFISLISNCFDNWETETIKSCFKPNITKKKW